jgi:N-acetylmuramoyl-L-alanine amidase
MDLSMNRQPMPAQAKILQGSKGYPIVEVCLHTSATTTTWWKDKTVTQMRDEIRDWHMHPAPPKTPWKDIGYHAVIAPDGTVAYGRKWSVIGAGVAGHNAGVIHFCMIPIKTIEKMGMFEDFYTEEQRDAVKSLIRGLIPQTSISLVSGHNQYAAKLCPGFKVKSAEWMP